MNSTLQCNKPNSPNASARLYTLKAGDVNELGAGFLKIMYRISRPDREICASGPMHNDSWFRKSPTAEGLPTGPGFVTDAHSRVYVIHLLVFVSGQGKSAINQVQLPALGSQLKLLSCPQWPRGNYVVPSQKIKLQWTTIYPL